MHKKQAEKVTGKEPTVRYYDQIKLICRLLWEDRHHTSKIIQAWVWWEVIGRGGGDMAWWVVIRRGGGDMAWWDGKNVSVLMSNISVFSPFYKSPWLF